MCNSDCQRPIETVIEQPLTLPDEILEINNIPNELETFEQYLNRNN